MIARILAVILSVLVSGIFTLAQAQSDDCLEGLYGAARRSKSGQYQVVKFKVTEITAGQYQIKGVLKTGRSKTNLKGQSFTASYDPKVNEITDGQNKKGDQFSISGSYVDKSGNFVVRIKNVSFTLRRNAKCKAPDTPKFDFRISYITGEKEAYPKFPAGDINIHWYGNPKFPVTAIYYARSCPPPLTMSDCPPSSQTFQSSADPLVMKGVISCWGWLPQRYVFDYAVKLRDALGRETEPVVWSFTCIF